MIFLKVLAIIALFFFEVINAINAENMLEKGMCGIMIMVATSLLAIDFEPIEMANYYLNHQDEFVVDTISVNGVVTELKIRTKND